MIRRVSLLILLGLGCFFTQTNQAQSLDDRTLQIVTLDLSDEPDIWSKEFNFEYTGSYPLTPLDFGKKKEVFWEAVDMGEAIAKENIQKNRNAQVRPIKVKSFGFSTAAQYNADSQTKVKNIVYKDMRGMQLVTPCPPVGMCWRCAPYRNSRFY